MAKKTKYSPLRGAISVALKNVVEMLDHAPYREIIGEEVALQIEGAADDWASWYYYDLRAPNCLIGDMETIRRELVCNIIARCDNTYGDVASPAAFAMQAVTIKTFRKRAADTASIKAVRMINAAEGDTYSTSEIQNLILDIREDESREMARPIALNAGPRGR
jgi:hypothetical protein